VTLATLDPIRAAMARGDSAAAIATFFSVVSGAPGGFAAMPATFQTYALAHAFEFAQELRAPPALWMPKLSCVDLEKVRMPVLLLRAARTALIFARTVDEMARCLPAERIVTIAGAGHGVVFDEPAVFNQTVLDSSGQSRGERNGPARGQAAAGQQERL
jgi:pimeloyl-ACP methyl ester carboxylesterase